MLAKTGLLVVSNPKKIGTILSTVQKQVKKTLYIQLLSALSEPFGNFHPNVFSSWPKYSQTIWGIYTQAAKYCQNLDVRVLLSGLKYTSVSKIQTTAPIDLVIFDKIYNRNDIDHFLKGKVANITTGCEVVTLDNAPTDFLMNSEANLKIYKHTVIGGTFDRLHVAHKLLLSEAALRSGQKLTIGVTEESMIQNKNLWELIEPIETRINVVETFLRDICPELEVCVVPISDPFGPTQSDPTMDMLVVSAETFQGGQKVNELRRNNGLKALDVIPVELIDEPFPSAFEELKISSSTVRMRLLGTLLKPVEKNDHLPDKPYIIGLTGGIASGKSAVSQKLQELGAEIVNADLVGHEMYRPGGPCHTLVVEAFGKSILDDNGEVNRKALGAIVFSDPKELKRLNALVWPAMAEEISNIIKRSKSRIVVVEAAVLLMAGWQKHCHEVWTTFVPHSEAIKRLQTRNNLTEEEAIARVASQPVNKIYVDQAHVVFCSLWSLEFGMEKVEKAWNLLQQRLPV